MKQFVYADNAATTKLDIDAFEAMKPYLLYEYGNASQHYSFARQPKKALKEARTYIAECINASPEEIYFTSGGTESDNWAIKGIALNCPVAQIITSQIEHHAILNSCKAVEMMGIPVAYLSVTRQGVVEPTELESVITNSTKLVSVMYANNEIGSIQPIKELCDIAHKKGALFHTDAVQAVGHIRIDVKELGIDLLSALAHKFNGPKGIGFLYVKKGTPIFPYANGGSQESSLRAGTENVAAIVGMAVALKKNCEQIDKMSKHITDLESKLLSLLKTYNVPFIRNGANNHLVGNISLSFPGKDGEAIMHILDLHGICVSTGAACDTVNTEISHVLKAIGLQEKYAKGTIRISLGKNNTNEDVQHIADSLKKIEFDFKTYKNFAEEQKHEK